MYPVTVGVNNGQRNMIRWWNLYGTGKYYLIMIMASNENASWLDPTRATTGNERIFLLE